MNYRQRLLNNALLPYGYSAPNCSEILSGNGQVLKVEEMEDHLCLTCGDWERDRVFNILSGNPGFLVDKSEKGVKVKLKEGFEAVSKYLLKD